MEMYVEQGESRKECEIKIAEKHRRPFQIYREKPVRIGGFLGIFSKPGVEVEYFFSQKPYKNTFALSPQPPAGYNVNDISLNAPLNSPLNTVSNTLSNLSFEEEKKKIIAMAKPEDKTTQKILESINEIKEKLENQSTGVKEEHPSFTRTAELLKQNDFSEKYINMITERMRKEIPLDTLDDFNTVQDILLEWIGESINIYKDDSPARKPKIMVLVGPTGVGKTTTIAKLAAIFGIGTNEIPAVDVRMITIDAFRIGAQEQLESIGNIMQIPVSCVDNKAALRKEIDLHREDIDLFLIDTIGKSPKDASKLGEMKEILEGAGRSAEYHLVISSGTKSSDIENILRQFEPFNYKSVILSKFDETDRIGNIISGLAEKKKPVSYITDGQTVPVDIRKASVVRFLINLDGFKVNREKIEKRFPSGEAEQFKWK